MSQQITKILDLPEVQEELSKVKSLEELTGPNGLIKQLLKPAIERILKGEQEAHLGYGPYAKEGNNSGNSRNGYSEKTITTSHGDVEIEVPRDRNGTYEPKVLPKFKKLDPDLEGKIISMYAKGMSTRDMAEHLSDLYGTEVSASFISTVTNRIMEEVAVWQSRPLEKLYPIVFFDALFFKTRMDSKVQNKASYTCLALNTEGKYDVLGQWINESEGAHFWLSVLSDLKARGVEDVLFACVDGLKGFPEAIKQIFPKAIIQQCIVHQIRNSLRYVGSKHQKEFLSDLKLIYRAPNLSAARMGLSKLEEKWNQKYPAVIASWQNNWETLTAYFSYPEPIRKIIYTTNIVESFHRRIRKITKSKSVFPSDESVTKIIYMIIRDIMKRNKTSKQGWAEIISSLKIIFEDRVNLSLS